MTPSLNFCRTLLFGLCLTLPIASVGRCEDPAKASRDTIIQGVRDDVRRKIREREANPPAAQPDAQTAGSGADATKPSPGKSSKDQHN
ncbi:hypothetical protein [Bradyrhizobium sp.]|uniref:hypothetical protein n=1 Tax=Bradyrhizobium sp. TaxID=376 RepID=UPI001E0648A4|nr:hypothetical protein [Bradyrhizobium sp.]MBI5323240.1 hypothetical protein [Bradyrhizobium sp.]